MAFEAVKTALEKKGYAVRCFDTKEAAVDYLCAEIHDTTVGFGGSVTLQELGLLERLKQNNELISHWYPKEGQSREETLAEAMKTKVYLCSVNGLAETGEIVNIDGTGNRVASTIFGHEKVYFVVGKNKLAPTEEAALWRARNIASPKNAQRLKRNTPCAVKADRCYNCSSPERICRAASIFWEAPKGAKYEVILVDEELGY